MSRRRIGLFSLLLSVLGGCGGVRHAAPVNAVFLIESREGALHLVPPSLPGGVAAQPVPFTQLLARQYGFNPWEQYVDLSDGMRLAVQRMTNGAQTANSYYAIAGAGRRGLRVRSLTPESETFDRRARHVRLFYQTKFLAKSGQPVRSALVLWSDTPERMGDRTAAARENPDFSCEVPVRDCLAFPGKTTVSPELQVVVNHQPRYVLLGSTVRDLLRADRVGESAEIRLLRKYRNRMVPVTWKQKAFAMSLPLAAGDDLSW